MRRFAILSVALALSAAACSDDTPITTPTPISVTDTFPITPPGSLNMNGGVSHDFSVSGSGEVRAQLTSLAPDTTQIIGFALGTWNGAGCQIILANDRATQGTIITGAATGAGTLCVRVYDVGRITDPVQY